MRKFLNGYFTEKEQNILFFLVLFAFVGIVVKYTGLVADNSSSEQKVIVFEQDYEIKYDLKIVTREELISIPGIGEKKADDILAYREENGFSNKAELMKIKGIGKKTFTKLEKYFIDLGSNEQPEEFYPEKENPNLTNKKTDPEQKVNVNSANLEEFQTLTGIGPSKAKKIIELRNKIGKFSDVNELLQVKGIGPKTLSKIQDRIIIGE